MKSTCIWGIIQSVKEGEDLQDEFEKIENRETDAAERSENADELKTAGKKVCEKKKADEKVRSTDNFVIFTVVGFFLGVILGFAVSAIPVCIVAGTIAGACFGLVLDDRKDKSSKDNKEKEEEKNV